MRRAAALLMIALAPTAHVRAQQRVAFVGDSHMQVLGPMARRDVRECARPVGIVARVGWSTRRYQLAGDLADVLRPMRPSVVVVMLGSNDYGIARARRYRPRVQWVVDEARRAGARRVIWIGPPAVDPERDDLARVAEVHERVGLMQREIMPDLGVPWIDAAPITRGHYNRSGYHMTRRGYRLLAAAVRERVCGGS